jgi:hypothetical protein
MSGFERLVGDLGGAPVVMLLLGRHGRHSAAGFKSKRQCIRQLEYSVQCERREGALIKVLAPKRIWSPGK